MLDSLFDLTTAAFGDRMARAARPWVFGLGLLVLILLAALLLRLAVG